MAALPRTKNFIPNRRAVSLKVQLDRQLHSPGTAIYSIANATERSRVLNGRRESEVRDVENILCIQSQIEIEPLGHPEVLGK